MMSTSSPPKKKQKSETNCKTNEKKSKEAVHVFVVQSEWIGLDEDGDEFSYDSDYDIHRPTKMYKNIHKIFSTKSSANECARKLYEKRTENGKKKKKKRKKRKRKSDDCDSCGLFNKKDDAPQADLTNLVDGWSDVLQHVWVEKKNYYNK